MTESTEELRSRVGAGALGGLEDGGTERHRTRGHCWGCWSRDLYTLGKKLKVKLGFLIITQNNML